MIAWPIRRQLLLLRLKNLWINLIKTATGNIVRQAMKIVKSAVIACVTMIQASKVFIFIILPQIVSARDQSMVVVLKLPL